MKQNLKWWLLLAPRIGDAFGLVLCYLCLFALAHALGGTRMERAAGRCLRTGSGRYRPGRPAHLSRSVLPPLLLGDNL